MIRASLGAAALLLGAGCALASLAPACTIHEVTTDEAPAFDEAPMLAHLANEVAVSSFQRVAVDTAALAAAAAALDDAPSADTLAAAQVAWRTARASWGRTAVFGFGPTKAAASRIDWVPADPAKIDARIAGDAPIDAASVATTGASERGFGAIEWLLFGAGEDVEALDPLEAEPRRRALCRALAEDLRVATDELRLAWEPAGGDFAGEIARAGDGSATFAQRKNATDAIVNESIFVIELVLGDELATPLGLRADGVPQPESVRSPWSDASIEDALAHLDALGAVYRGAAAPGGGAADASGGLSDLVVARGGEELDADVREALTRARAAVAAIPAPLRAAVVSSPASVQLAYDEVRELKRLLAADVATAVGTTLSFNDNDGD